MTRIELQAQGPFSLAASAAFLCGFTPASGATRQGAGALQLGLLLEPSYQPVVLSIVQHGARVVAECDGHVDEAQLRTQLGRVLSLDRDATGLLQVAARDPVIGRALAQRPGFRPVCFASAYEAAVWGVLSQRTPMRVAARLKHKLAAHTDSIVRAHGDEFALAPRPERLLELGDVGGIPGLKLERLRGLAAAALSGGLHTERLRALPRTEALAQLSTLPGVGAWTAELIRMRGTGVVDELTATEPRVFEAVGHAYGLGRAASEDELQRLSRGWRPYRSWISVLLVSGWMRGEVSGGAERTTAASGVRTRPAHR